MLLLQAAPAQSCFSRNFKMTQKIKCTHVTGSLMMHLLHCSTDKLDCETYSVLDNTVMIKWLTTVPSPPTLESDSVWYSSCPSSRPSVLESQRDRWSGWHHHHILERAGKSARTTHNAHAHANTHHKHVPARLDINRHWVKRKSLLWQHHTTPHCGGWTYELEEHRTNTLERNK